MASLPNSKTVTYEEWLRMPVVRDAIEEVVNGQIHIMPPNKWTHTRVVTALYDLIRPQIDERVTLVISAPFGVIVRRDPLTIRVPDLAVFERSTIVEQDGYIQSAPQLVVEVLSPGNTRSEREEKLGDYARLGVPEVWVISPEGRTIEVLYLQEGFLRSSHILNQGTLQPKHFPHVEIHIPEIWPD